MKGKFSLLILLGLTLPLAACNNSQKWWSIPTTSSGSGSTSETSSLTSSTYSTSHEIQTDYLTLSLSSSTLIMNIGDYALLTVASNLPTDDVTYSIDNPSIAHLEGNLVYGVSVGKCQVTATLGKLTSTQELNVTADPAITNKVTGLSFALEDGEQLAQVGDKAQYKVSFTTEKGGAPTIDGYYLFSEDTDVIDIINNRLVAKQNGKATVTAISYDGFIASSKEFTISSAVSGNVELEISTMYLSGTTSTAATMPTITKAKIDGVSVDKSLVQYKDLTDNTTLFDKNANTMVSNTSGIHKVKVSLTDSKTSESAVKYFYMALSKSVVKQATFAEVSSASGITFDQTDIVPDVSIDTNQQLVSIFEAGLQNAVDEGYFSSQVLKIQGSSTNPNHVFKGFGALNDTNTIVEAYGKNYKRFHIEFAIAGDVANFGFCMYHTGDGLTSQICDGNGNRVDTRGIVSSVERTAIIGGYYFVIDTVITTDVNPPVYGFSFYNANNSGTMYIGKFVAKATLLTECNLTEAQLSSGITCDGIKVPNYVFDCPTGQANSAIVRKADLDNATIQAMNAVSITTRSGKTIGFGNAVSKVYPGNSHAIAAFNSTNIKRVVRIYFALYGSSATGSETYHAICMDTTKTQIGGELLPNPIVVNAGQVTIVKIEEWIAPTSPTPAYIQLYSNTPGTTFEMYMSDVRIEVSDS